MLIKKKRGQAESAYWLQQELVLWGIELDLPSWTWETRARRMVTTGLVTLGQVLALTGPQMKYPSGLGAPARTKLAGKLLDHWKSKISRHDRMLLVTTKSMVAEEDPFPAKNSKISYALEKLPGPSCRLQAPVEGTVQASTLQKTC